MPMFAPVLQVVRSFHGLSSDLDAAGGALDASIMRFRAVIEHPAAPLEEVAAAARAHLLVMAHFSTLISAAAQAEARAG